MKILISCIFMLLVAFGASAQRKPAAQPGFKSFVIAYPNTRQIIRKPLLNTQAELRNNYLNIAFTLDSGEMLQLNGIPVSLLTDTALHAQKIVAVFITNNYTMTSERPVKLTIRKLSPGNLSTIRVHAIARVSHKTAGRMTFEMQYVGIVPEPESIKEYKLEIIE